MTKQNYIFIALFVAVLILALALGCSFMINANAKAHADYESDYLNNPRAIVNFNQYVNFTSTSSHQLVSIVNGQSVNIPATLNQNIYCNVQIPFENGHKYYFYTNNYSRSVEITNDSGTPYVSLSSQYVLFTSGGSATGTRFYFLNGMDAGNYSFIYIDLTQMFGVGNEPNLEQCKQLFTADYYPYNTGTSIPFSGYESYNQGVIDTLNSYNNFAVNLSAISSAFIDSSINNSNAFVRKFYEPSNTDYSYYLQARGYLSIPFNTTIDSGNLITFKYYDPGQGGSGLYLWCGVYYQNTFYPVMFIGDNTGKTISFASPVSTQYLMFADSTTRDTFTFSDSAYWLGDFVVNNAKFDMNTLLDSVRTNAYSEKDQYYQTYYGENGTGYNAIYDSGYNTGINAQLSEAGRHFYTFPQFLGALFDVPVRTITSLLDFNVLGFNLKNFFFSLITLSIVFALIKFILVRTGDK